MSTQKLSIWGSSAIRYSIALSFCALHCIRGALAQNASEATAGTKQVQQSMKHLEDGNFHPTDARILAGANVQSAVPALERRFITDSDPLTKVEIALALIQLHDGSNLYINYLLSQAQEVLKDSLPSSAVFDADGKVLPTPSAALTQWADKHQLSVAAATEKAVILDPGLMMQLAQTRDPQAIPIIEQGLTSNNYFFHIAAATGLVMFDEPASIVRASAVCKKDPLYVSKIMATRLIWSSNPEAQRVAASYLSKDELEDVRQQKAAGRTISGGPDIPSTAPDVQH